MKEQDKNKDLYIDRKTKINTFVKAVGLVSIILILGSGIAYFVNLNNEAGDELKTNNTLGKALDDAGWMLYAQQGCGACGEQRVILGTAIRDIKVIDCREDARLCYEQGITVVPTWINVFSNETRLGAQNIEELRGMAK